MIYFFGKDGIVQHLKKGDIVIDAANAFLRRLVRPREVAQKARYHFMDVGFSGGPSGARNGGIAHDRRRETDVRTARAALPPTFPCRRLFVTLAPRAAATFVKMVHMA